MSLRKWLVGLVVLSAWCGFGQTSTVMADLVAYSVRTIIGDDHLYAINLNTGAATDLGLVNFNDAEGMASVGNKLVAIGGHVDEFWDITRPPGEKIGDTGPRDRVDAGLAYNPVSGKLYNINGGPSSTALYEIDPSTGAATLIGSHSTWYDVAADSLAIDSSGNAYAARFYPPSGWPYGTVLFSVDLATGLKTEIGDGLGVATAEQSGMAFDASDTLWAITSGTQTDNDPSKIYTIDPSTGEATFVTEVTLDGTAIRGFAALSFHGHRIPEPSSFVIMAGMILLGLILFGRRLKKS